MTAKAQLLIVDDEPDMLEGLRRVLGYEMPALKVTTCEAPRMALDLVRRERPDLVLLDVRMPQIDGMTLLEILMEEDASLTCIMMTAYGTIEMAVAAIKAGAYDFIAKPFENEELMRLLGKGLERNRLILENRNLRRNVGVDDFYGMVGRSAPMQHLFEQIQATARSDYSVLIRGESGTGKELAARALHCMSRRNRSPLVTVNCAAIPEHLLESELFGHRRGAFTGADHDQRGLFEEADGGTLFLDEVAELPVAVQAKLLRALQDGEIRSLGASRMRRVDVRIVAATNQNLEARIRERTFREDLYYRLNVVTLRTPTLREVSEDIPLMASRFIRLAGAELGIEEKRLAPEALTYLAGQPWPGNVRQLQNAVRRAMMFAAADTISVDDFVFPEAVHPLGLPAHLEADLSADGIVPYKDAKALVVDRFTRHYVTDLLAKTGGNVSQGAVLSGIGRPSLHKIIRRLGLRPDTPPLNG